MVDRTKPADRMRLVNALPGLTGNERAVLVALAFYDGAGGCYPKDETLLANTPLEFRSSVVQARKGLHRKGRLRWKRGRYGNVYEVAYGETFAFEMSGAPEHLTLPRCPGLPDSQMSGAPEHRTGKEREERGEESDGGPPDPPPCTAATPLGFGEREGKRAAGKGESLECPEGRACGWLGMEGDRCRTCGAI